MHLQGSDNGLGLTITDDGAGFDVNAAWGKGVGLVSMVERLQAIGGTLEISSTPGAGTRLTATVPVHVIQNGRKRHAAGAKATTRGFIPEAC
jgi:signal transduction histidine kinase